MLLLFFAISVLSKSVYTQENSIITERYNTSICLKDYKTERQRVRKSVNNIIFCGFGHSFWRRIGSVHQGCPNLRGGGSSTLNIWSFHVEKTIQMSSRRKMWFKNKIICEHPFGSCHIKSAETRFLVQIDFPIFH